MLFGILIATVVQLGFWIIVAAFCGRLQTFATVAGIFVLAGLVIRVYQWPVSMPHIAGYLVANAFWATLAWLIVSWGRQAR